MIEKGTSINISWSTLWRIFFFSLLIIIFYLAREVIAVLLAAIIISLGLEPFVSFFEQRKIPRILGVLIMFFLVFVIFSAAIYIVVPIIVAEAVSFFDHFNQVFSSIFGFSFSRETLDIFKGSLDEILKFIRTSDISIKGTVSRALNNFVLVVVTILVTFYLMVEKDGVERFFQAILPDAYERTFFTIFNRFKIKIRRWVFAQFTLSLILGIITGVGVWLLGVRYPAVIGVLAAIFEIVPVIGPLFVGLVTLFIAFSDSLLLGFYVLIFFAAVQQLESHVLTPIIVGRTMRIHPVVIIISLIGGAHVAGFVGVILAAPIAVLTQEIIGFISESKSQRPRLDI